FRAQLLPVGGGLLRISGARIPCAQILPGSFAAHRETAARSTCGNRAGAKNLRRIFETLSAFAEEKRGGRGAGGISVAAKQPRDLRAGKERGTGRSAAERAGACGREVGGVFEWRGESARGADARCAERRSHADCHFSRELCGFHLWENRQSLLHVSY